MKFLVLVLGLVALSAGVPQRFRPRQGRQNSYLAPPEAASSDVDTAYLAPSDSYGAAASDNSVDYAAPPSDSYGAASDEPAAAPSDAYGAASDDFSVAAPADSYGAAASEISYDDYDPSDVPADQAGPQPAYTPVPADESDMGLKMLMNAVPGTPGEDYPIYAEAPETGFTCDDKVNGGYYADPEAECQVFHVCTSNSDGGLSSYSFLCPNGTIFNQNYFICDWWFNFDCSQATALAAEKNAELADARSAASETAAAAASESDASYAAPAPADAGYGAPEEAASDEVLSGYVS